MTLVEQVYNQARVMAPELTEENQALLEAVCAGAVTLLRSRLRDNLQPEDCLADFVSAAAMHTLAAMSGLGGLAQLEQVTAGDITLRKTGSGLTADYLRYHAELLMRPYTKSGFVFMGV